MYANLRVTTSTGETLHAWKVEVNPGETVVYVDTNDGQGSYAVEAGKRAFPREVLVNVAASF